MENLTRNKHHAIFDARHSRWQTSLPLYHIVIRARLKPQSMIVI